MTNKKTYCLACGVFKMELAVLISQGKLDCEVMILESMLHMKPGRLEQAMRQAMATRPTDRFLLLYGDCHPHMHEIQRTEKVSRVMGINCCEILLGQAAYRKLQKDQAFLFLPEWTLRWREVFAGELGFTQPETAQDFIHEHRRRLVYADTGVIPVPHKTLEDISAFFGMPVEIRPVSLENLVEGINSALEKFTIHGRDDE